MPPLKNPPNLTADPNYTGGPTIHQGSGGGGGGSVDDFLGGGQGGGGRGGGAQSGISANTAINTILKKNPGWRQYVPAINALAAEYDVDRVFLLAALIASKTKVADFARFTKRFAQALTRHATPQDAFRAVAPRAPGRFWVPPRYAVGARQYYEGTGSSGGGGGGGRGGGGRARAPKLTPEEQVLQSIYKSELKESLTNPWVVIKNGRIRFSTALRPPKGSLGVRRDEFMDAWGDINELFDLYIGRKAKAGEVANILKKGWSEYTIRNWLSKRPGFKKGRLWASTAPALNGFGRDLFGTDVWGSIPQKERDELIRRAIVEDWSGDTFAEKLRQRPEYLRSVEFRTQTAGLQSVYEGIYGLANADTMRTIREAALARWTPDQFAAYLRRQPGYTSSPEYLTKALGVLDALGMIAGSVGPALVPGAAPANPAAGNFGPVPDSERIPGAPAPPSSPVAGLTAGFA